MHANMADQQMHGGQTGFPPSSRSTPQNAPQKHPLYWTNMLGGNDGRKREGRHCRQVVLLSQSFPGWICVGIRSNLPLTRIGDSAINQLGCGNRWHARCSGATRIFHRPAARSGVLV